MLFFLRKVRKQLMKDNKVVTYLLYAIGEIFLVIVGILIAVQIDSAYQVSQTRNIEIKYLKEMRDNLTFDLIDINYNITFNESRLQSNQFIFNHLRKRFPYQDSLSFHLSNLLFSTRSLPNTSAYESLKSKGFEIIANDSLRSQITTLYAVDYHNVIDFEHADDHAYQYNILIPEVMKAIEIDSLGHSAQPINYDELMDNLLFKNALAINLTYRSTMLEYYYELREIVTQLISHIETELKRID